MDSGTPVDLLAAKPSGLLPDRTHLWRLARQMTSFASVQLAVQIIGFATGILLVRSLDQREYAFFTIANSTQGAMNVLADIGISIGLTSIGGRVWHDSRRFGELVNTGLRLRRRLAAIAIVGISPVLYLMLTKNGASLEYAILLIIAVLCTLSVQLSYGVLEVVPRLHSNVRRIQTIDFTGSLARLLILAECSLFFLNAGVAAFAGSGALLLQYLMMRAYTAGVIDLEAPENPADRKAIVGFIRSQAPNALFFCCQGQITIFLISFFGHRAGAVAEVGALGRLAMIFTVLSALLTNILAPAFARCQVRYRLRQIYAGITVGVVSLSMVILLAAFFFPREFLFVLGPKYSHLDRELLLIIGAGTLNMVAATLWTLNAARGWVSGSWIYIPLTLGTQIALIPLINFSTVNGVLTFNLISALPSLFLNLGLSYRGFRNTESLA